MNNMWYTGNIRKHVVVRQHHALADRIQKMRFERERNVYEEVKFYKITSVVKVLIEWA